MSAKRSKRQRKQRAKQHKPTMKLVKLQCLSHIIDMGVTRRCQRDAGHGQLPFTTLEQDGEMIPPHQHRFKRTYDGGWQLWTWNNDYEIEYSSGGEDE